MNAQIEMNPLIGEVLSADTVKQKDQHRTQFLTADPFKHVHIPGFLQPSFVAGILQEFPEPPGQDKLRNEFGGGSRKHAVHHIRELGSTFQRWDDLLKSEEFIDYLAHLTGIEGLIYDPEYHGAGTHNNLDGQGMMTHIDFNLHRTTNYHRRLNLIIYLNDEWQAEWGGSLELHKDPWNPDQDEVKVIPPFLNHAILFETNEYSWHGFEKIRLPEEKKHLSRKSLTVYYYSKTRPATEVAPKHGTIYVPRPIPASIKPGVTLDENSYQDLKENTRAQSLYLKSMYKRESDLLSRIQNLNFRLSQFQTNHTVKSIGQGLQQRPVTGLLPNAKMIETMHAEFRAMADLASVIAHVHIPEFLVSNDVIVKIDDQTFTFDDQAAGKVELVCAINIAKNALIEIEIQAQRFASPHEINGSPDKQKFALSFLYFEFQSAVISSDNDQTD